MNVYDQAYALVKALKESNEYKNFKKVKDLIDKDASAKKMLEDFLEKRLEIQRMELMGQEIPQRLMDEAERIEEIVSMHPKIAEYLRAEFTLMQILADIQKIIADGMEDLQ